jgi:hypothetical protein
MHHTTCTMHHTTCTIQHAPCTIQHAPCTIQHAPYNMHHAPYNMHHTTCTMHHTTCTMHHTTCTIQHAPCTIQHAPCTIQHAPCTIQHAPCYTIPRSHGPHAAPMRRKRAMPCSRASGPSSQQFEGWLSSCMHTRAGGSVGAPWATERASSGERSRRTSKPLPAPPRPALTTAEIVN